MSSEPANGASTDLVYVADHARRSARRLLSQDWDKPRMVALAEALGAGTQGLEDVTFDLLIGRRLEAATGAQLDQWGSIVGEARGAIDDRDYRRFIEARILANISKGTVDDVLGVWERVTYPANIRYQAMYPAGFKLYAVRPKWLAPRMRRRIRRIMEDVRPAGVTLALIEALGGYFGFEGGEASAGYNVGKFARVL